MANKNLLNSVKMTKLGRSTFDNSHDVKLSCNMGDLIPICCEELVPGDIINIGGEAIVRMAPMLAPIMHRVSVTIHYFKVPMRILWDNFEKFITNTEEGGALPAFPTLSYDEAGWLDTKLWDYLGLPPVTGANSVTISAMYHAAYQAICNEYYRDQNLSPEINYHLIGGSNNANLDLIDIRKRAWKHDYFTACLPFAQKGDAVEIPIVGDVTLKGAAGDGNPPYGSQKIVDAITGGNATGAGPNHLANTGGSASSLLNLPAGGGTNQDVVLDPNGTMEVANAQTTITDLRRATALQQFLEKMARAGSRFKEFLKGVFNVDSSDARLQRPEYIGGSVTPIMISETMNTTGTVDAPQGTPTGNGIAVPQSGYGKTYVEEHSILMGIMSIIPDSAYQDGVPRKFLKINDPFEYFVPDFEHIGEQEVSNIEIYADQGATAQRETFGYLPRYAEYKVAHSRVAGQFRSTLDYWHMGRKFSSPPSLNQQFIECDPTFRIFAVEDPEEDHLWCVVHNKLYMNRQMSKYSTPTF